MKKVLVIDDSSDVRLLVTDTLGVHGFKTLQAGDGMSGVDLARKELPDLILCDVRMPKLDGYGTLAAIREHPPTAAIPFVFLTAVADQAKMRLGMDLGADDYLVKPFTLGELLAAVRARLEKQAIVQGQAEKKLEELRGNLCMALPHELLTPLNSISGFASLLAERAPRLDPDEVEEYARTICHAAGRLERLIQNFLLYANLQLIQSDPHQRESFRTHRQAPIRERVILVAEAKAKEHRRFDDLALDLEQLCFPVPSDQLEKIIRELVDNAFKFSKPGTPVIISGRAGDGQWLMISDCGRGMTSEQVARIGAHLQFDRELHEQQGSGLGLALAKQLVELHGGEFHLRSEPDLGTEVRIIFP